MLDVDSATYFASAESTIPGFAYAKGCVLLY